MESIRAIRERNLLDIAKTTTGDDAILLQRISHRLHQLDENSCNYGLTKRQEKRVDRLEEQAQAIAGKYLMLAYHQSDPRGWSLYLVSKAAITETQPIDAIYDRGLAICPH